MLTKILFRYPLVNGKVFFLIYEDWVWLLVIIATFLVCYTLFSVLDKI